jgi:hypothetical protein
MSILLICFSCQNTTTKKNSTNRYQDELQELIDRYQKSKKLNKVEYESISKEIDIKYSFSNINEATKNSLIKSLNITHTQFLQDSIRNFCRMVNQTDERFITPLEAEANNLKNIRKNTPQLIEVRTFDLNPTDSLIKIYKTLCKYVNYVPYYIKYLEYNEYQTSIYKKYLEAVSSNNYFKNNTVILSKITESIEFLNNHLGINLQFTNVVNCSTIDCEEQFKNYDFYINACKVQKITNELSEYKETSLNINLMQRLDNIANSLQMKNDYFTKYTNTKYLFHIKEDLEIIKKFDEKWKIMQNSNNNK